MNTRCGQNVVLELSCLLFWPALPLLPSKLQLLFLLFSFFLFAAMEKEVKLTSRPFFFVLIKARKCIYVALVVLLKQTDTSIALPFSVRQPWVLRFFIIVCLVQVTNQALNRAWLVTWQRASQWRRRLLRSSFLSWQLPGNKETTKVIWGRRSNTKRLWRKLCMCKRGMCQSERTCFISAPFRRLIDIWEAGPWTGTLLAVETWCCSRWEFVSHHVYWREAAWCRGGSRSSEQLLSMPLGTAVGSKAIWAKNQLSCFDFNDV